MKKKESISGKREGALPVLASNLVGRVSTEGLISSNSPLNRFSQNVGVALPLNGNAEELLFLGEIRGV
ncbi:MAG TPA: hypothetical protein ACFYD3_07420 [Candidatus Hypogeohydataceae bacterium YC41]